MRRETSLEPAIGTYRLVFTWVAVISVLMAIIAAVGYMNTGLDTGLPLLLVVVRATAAAALILILRWGYVRLKRELGQVADEHRQHLELAYSDALTGAQTRSYFFDTLRDALWADQPAAYLQIDMDNLKVLNDSHGHGAGDAALVHLVTTLKSLLPEASIGRLGGDEFGIMVVGQDNKAALVRLGDQILEQLRTPVNVEGRQLRLSATIGIAVWPHDAAEMDELISKADLALYKGKKQGRSCTVAFDAELLADERHKRFVERDLRAAILLNELELHYQPILAADGRTVMKHEALVRWQHPVRGRILPGEFVAVAEQSDLIDKLGDWVVRRACLDFDRLGAPSVAINVSVVQLRRPDFAERFAAILADCEVEGARLVIEVTESLPLTQGTVELRNIDALRALGVRIAIDDFGAGFASLEYLRGFPFDIIKIDRSYVANLPQSRIDGLIVSAIVKIARSLKVEVIAEGIETEAQFEFLKRLGVTGMQGYLLARPQPLGVDGELIASAA